MTPGQLTWITLATRGEPPSEISPQPLTSYSSAAADSLVARASALFSQLSQQVPGVHLPDSAASENGMPTAGGVGQRAVTGVWVQSGALEAALKVLIVYLANLL